MKILVPTDFSENATNALAFAKNIAKISNASITLLYTFYAIYDFASQADEILKNIEKDAKKAMKKATEESLQEGIKINYKILQGTVATSVTTLAYREQYDLIVMGTQGASGIKKALVGSNTGQVIKESKIPVLVIPSSAKWETLNKISIGVELKNEEEHFFNNLFKITMDFQLPYEFFHFENTLSFQQSLDWKGLERHLMEKYPDQKMKFIIEPSKGFEANIKNYLQSNEGALLVMFFKDKSFFEYLFNTSQTVQMAYHTHVPLLVIN